MLQVSSAPTRTILTPTLLEPSLKPSFDRYKSTLLRPRPEFSRTSQTSLLTQHSPFRSWSSRRLRLSTAAPKPSPSSPGARHDGKPLSRAKAISLPTESLNLRQILARAPSIPDKIPSKVQYIEGHSTWKNSDVLCPLKTRTEKARIILLRKRYRTICTISTSNNFRVWGSKTNNGIALLVLGWAYILSAELAERQGLPMEYVSPLSMPSGLTALNLDYTSPHELAWWKAVVRHGVGWSIAGG